jgi:hypothetical protein
VWARELVPVGEAAELVANVVDRAFTATYFADVPVRPVDLGPADRDDPLVAVRPTDVRARAATKIEADLLLVSSHFAAHGATVHFPGPSIVYCHTPARMLWRPDMDLGRARPGSSRRPRRTSGSSTTCPTRSCATSRLSPTRWSCRARRPSASLRAGVDPFRPERHRTALRAVSARTVGSTPPVRPRC